MHWNVEGLVGFPSLANELHRHFPPFLLTPVPPNHAVTVEATLPKMEFHAKRPLPRSSSSTIDLSEETVLIPGPHHSKLQVMIKVLINSVCRVGAGNICSLLGTPCANQGVQGWTKKDQPARHTKASLVTELPVMELDINIYVLTQYYSSSTSSTQLPFILPVNKTHLKRPRTSTFASANPSINYRTPYIRNASPRELPIFFHWL